MEVRGIDQIPLALFQPDCLIDGLTVGTVPVPAGSCSDLYGTAFRTLVVVAPQFTGPAFHDAAGRGELLGRKTRTLFVIIEGQGKYLPDAVFSVRHGSCPGAHRLILSMEFE